MGAGTSQKQETATTAGWVVAKVGLSPGTALRQWVLSLAKASVTSPGDQLSSGELLSCPHLSSGLLGL